MDASGPVWFSTLAALTLGASGACYAAVAVVAKRRAPQGGANEAAYSVAWAGLGSALLAVAATFAAEALGVRSRLAEDALFESFVVGNAIAAGGFLAHVASRYGAARLMPRVGLAFGVVYAVAFTLANARIGTSWEAVAPALQIALVSGFFLPHVVIAFAYGGLALRDQPARLHFSPLAVGAMVLLACVGWLFVFLGGAMHDTLVMANSLVLSMIGPAGVLFAHQYL